MPLNTLIELLVEIATYDDRVRVKMLKANLSADEFLMDIGFSRQQRIHFRNKKLRAAAEILMADGCSQKVGFERFVNKLNHYRRCSLPRASLGVDIDFSPSEWAIHHAFLSGVAVPDDVSHLRKILF